MRGSSRCRCSAVSTSAVTTPIIRASLPPLQAAYTAGVVLPKPVASCKYWHRTMDAKKLIETGFTRLQVRRPGWDWRGWGGGSAYRDCSR